MPQPIKIPFVVAVVLVLTAVSFLPSLNNSFTNWDDPEILLENPFVRDLSFGKFGRILTHPVMGNYHPLTTLSFAVEYRFFKDAPWIYHFDNLLLHVVNTGLVFYLIFLLKGTTVAAVTAALFGIHPMHVESVAWVTERKDVLYTFFYLSALIGYVKGKKLWCWLFFVLSLLSKVQAVSFPVALLVMDYFLKGNIHRRAWIEKVPFFMAAFVVGGVGLWAAGQKEAFHYAGMYSFVDRIILAGYILVVYLLKLIVPVKLSAIYPFPAKVGGLFLIEVYAAWVLLAGAAAGLFRQRRTRLWRGMNDRVVIFGALFFLATIVWTLQIVPVGHGFMADRFVYLPSLGIFFIVGCFIERLLARLGTVPKGDSPRLRPAAALFALYLLALIFMTTQQCAVWKNSLSLWSHAIRQYPGFHEPYFHRADYYRRIGDIPGAINDYNQSLALNPRYVKAYANRGSLYHDLGQLDLALKDYNTALAVMPERVEIYGNRANLLSQKGQYDLAALDYAKALTASPADPFIYYNRGLMYLQKGDYRLALQDILKAQSLGLPVDEKFLIQLKQNVKF